MLDGDRLYICGGKAMHGNELDDLHYFDLCTDLSSVPIMLGLQSIHTQG